MKQGIKLWGRLLVVMLCFALAALPHKLAAQQTGNPITDSLSEIAGPLLDTFSARIETQWVMLDGRRVVLVAAPAISQATLEDSSPVAERADEIQRQLRNIARDVVEGSLPAQVNATPYSDESTLYVIDVADRYLMSVTPWDAQASGIQSIEAAAAIAARDIQQALDRAVEERKPTYLRKASIYSVSIAIAVTIQTWLLSRLRGVLRRAFSTRLQGFAEAVPLPTATKTLEEAWPEEIDEQQEAEQAAAQQRWKVQKNRLRLLQDLLGVVLQVVQWGAIVCGSLIVLNFFPQTRYIKTSISDWLTESALKVLLLAIGTYVLFRLSLVVIDSLFSSYSQRIHGGTSTRLGRRLKTFSGILKSVAGTIVVSAGILLFLPTINVDVGPILAGAGLIGLAVSFASQSLVKDVINGFFILLEDQFSEGDVIATGDYAGVVEDLSLRVTRLRSADGNLIVVPNSSISVVENLTNGFSRANLGIDIAYDTDLDFAIATIDRVAQDMAQDADWQKAIVQPPQVLGVDNFGDNSITIRLWIDTQPLKQWSVGREYRRRLKYAFDRCGISIPFPQRSIWFETPLNTQNRQLSESELQQLIEQRQRSLDSRTNPS